MDAIKLVEVSLSDRWRTGVAPESRDSLHRMSCTWINSDFARDLMEQANVTSTSKSHKTMMHASPHPDVMRNCPGKSVAVSPARSSNLMHWAPTQCCRLVIGRGGGNGGSSSSGGGHC